jgi:hypothetical protein
MKVCIDGTRAYMRFFFLNEFIAVKIMRYDFLIDVLLILFLAGNDVKWL